MAKMFTINFTESPELITIAGENKTLKELEIILLTNLFGIALDHQSQLSKAFECKDCIDDLIKVDGFSIDFTKEDIDYLIEAFELTVDKRPAWWFDYCSNLLRQIETRRPE